jgi:hypothetical protein
LSLSRVNPGDLGPFSDIIKQEEEKARNLFIIGRLEASWEKIVGSGLFPYSRPLKVEGNVLKMIVPNSAYKMEFTFIRDMVLKNINSALDFYKIYSYRITVGNFKSLNTERPIAKRSLEGKESLVAQIENETDPIIKEKLLSLIQLF